MTKWRQDDDANDDLATFFRPLSAPLETENNMERTDGLERTTPNSNPVDCHQSFTESLNSRVIGGRLLEVNHSSSNLVLHSFLVRLLLLFFLPFHCFYVVLHYTELPAEGDCTSSNDPPPTWPMKEKFTFSNVEILQVVIPE